MQQNENVFVESLPIVAAALGRQCGVTIHFGADCAKTDGEVIDLPTVTAATEDEERRILGLLCHESGHVRFTDMKTSDRTATPLEFSIDNALEDVRIERLMNGLYPGAEHFFEAAHRPTVAELTEKPLPITASILPLFLLAVAEEQLMNRTWLSPLVKKARIAVQSLMGATTTADLETLALGVRDAQSVKDVQAIRRQIMRLLGHKAQQVRVPGNDQPASFSLTPLRGMLADVGPVDNPLSLSQAFERLTPSHRGTKHPSGLKKWPGSAKVRPTLGKAFVGKQRLTLARQDSAELRSSLLRLVQSKDRVQRQWTDRGRRLDSRRLARLMTGENRLFIRRTDRRTVSTAVHVLLDLSGSMGYTGGELALRAALGLIQALESIPRANPALTVFPGTACGRKEYACCTVLEHGKRLATLDPRELGAIESFGSTPVIEALMTARRALSSCREKAKAVFLVTDGDVPETAFKAEVALLAKAGIRLYGIQIGNDVGITQYLTDAERIHDIADLKAVLFQFAERLLV